MDLFFFKKFIYSPENHELAEKCHWVPENTSNVLRSEQERGNLQIET